MMRVIVYSFCLFIIFPYTFCPELCRNELIVFLNNRLGILICTLPFVEYADETETHLVIF